MMKPFRPYLPAIRLSCTATSAESTALTGGNGQAMLFNAGPNVAFVRFGNVALTAATTDLPVPVDSTPFVITVGAATRVAAICAATETASLYITPGDGA